MWVPFVFGLCVLVYVAIADFRCRLVSNWVWVFAYPIGCALTLVGLVFSLVDVGVVLVSFVCSMFLGLVLFYSGFYGGADVKALIFIGLTLPTIPLTLNHTLGVPVLPLVLVMFCNSTLLSLIWPLSIFVLNLNHHLRHKRACMFEGIKLSLRQKVWLLFTAKLTPLDKIGVRYFPAETVVTLEEEGAEEGGKPTRKLLRFVRAETDLKKHKDNLMKHSELYKNGVLASPTIPTALFFTLALAITPMGNLIFFFVAYFFGVI